MALGIISAMPEEIEAILPFLEIKQSYDKGQRIYHQGILFKQEVILVFSRWGKVAAATTVTQLINDFDIEEIIFTGVAGSIDKITNIGDIVIGDRFYQHDMDASPILKKFEIPLLKKQHIASANLQRAKLLAASESFINHINNFVDQKVCQSFNIINPQVHIGAIASGDQFINKPSTALNLKEQLPNVLCVEMEGAAIAQVCFEYSIPFNVIRTISDKADDNAAVDFPQFAKHIASFYALGILQYYLQ